VHLFIFLTLMPHLGYSDVKPKVSEVSPAHSVGGHGVYNEIDTVHYPEMFVITYKSMVSQPKKHDLNAHQHKSL
jgi:hypothetical protein